MHISQSIRTGKYDEAFGLKPKYRQQSARYLGNLYKKALLKTQSMMGQIPFVHS